MIWLGGLVILMKTRYKINNYILAGIPLTLFVFFTFFDGYVWCVDSPTYVNMTIDREPIYPLFLLFFRMIFKKEEVYLLVAVLFQGLLMAYAIYSFSKYITDKFKMNIFEGIFIECIFLTVSLLCRFAAKRGSMYSNSILSESLAYPLFVLFFRYLLQYLYDNDNKSLIIASALSFVLISTRKQMYLSLFLLIIVFVYQMITTRRSKDIYKILIICLLVIGSNKLLDYTYNYAIRGLKATHTSGDRFPATVVFYCSTTDNASSIQDAETRTIFMKVSNECDKKGLLKTNTNGGWYEYAMHFCDNYDLIQLHNMWPMEKDYVLSLHNVNDNEAEVIVDSYNKIIIRSLVPKVWPVILHTFACNFLLGLMTTVAAVKSVFKYYMYFICLSYLTLLITYLVKKKEDDTTKLSVIVFLSVVMNVGIVSMVIFPQTRYTIYNMGLFYTAGFLMLKGLVKALKQPKKN